MSAGEPAPAIAGYSILEADSAEALTELLRSHPFIARGGTLQINQALGA